MLLIATILAAVSNIILLLIKFRCKRYPDGALDLFLLYVVFKYLQGSELVTLVAIFSSLAISIYLWFYPPLPNLSFKLPTRRH